MAAASNPEVLSWKSEMKPKLESKSQSGSRLAINNGTDLKIKSIGTIARLSNELPEKARFRPSVFGP